MNKYGIEPGQFWRAASGENFGYTVLGFKGNGDVRVCDWTGVERTIDAFKLTYRYKLSTRPV